MLYLLFALTFLAGILFYGLSPNDQHLQEYTHQSEGMVIPFVAQHQAAKDYLYTWMGSAAPDDNNYVTSLQSDQFLNKEFEEMMPKTLIPSMCEENNVVPSTGCFVSKVVTVSGSPDKHYVITYGGWNTEGEDEYKRPDWWPKEGQRMRRFESWRKAIAKRTRGSISCGVLFPKDGTASAWCIDNGESAFKKDGSCMTEVPSQVIDALPGSYKPTSGNIKASGLYDLLFCMTEYTPGLGNYVNGLSHFYDGLSNNAFGKYAKQISNAGINLASTSPSPEKLSFELRDDPALNTITVCNARPCYTLATNGQNIDTSISLSGHFTITVLAKFQQNASNVYFTDDSDSELDSRKKLFQKRGCSGNKCFEVFFQPTSSGSVVGKGFVFESYNNPPTKSRLTSWTITSDGMTMKFYENAVLRRQGTIRSDLSGNFSIYVADSHGVDIYGIRSYSKVLTPDEIRKNFEVDQRRFGISDVSNGKTSCSLSIDSAETDGTMAGDS